jgi:uncharacterized protein (DUF1015 family)
MRLFAFEGIRYTPVAGDVAELASLPSDQINDALRIRYHVKSPQQFTQLTRPVAAPGGNPFQNAADLHRQWLEEGVVKRDERPAVYPYVIDLASGGQRLGVFALVDLDGAGEAAPESLPADRVALLEEARADLEPVFLLAEDGGRLDELVRQDAAQGEALVRHEDPDENLHTLYKVDDPARIALYKEAAAGPVKVASGQSFYQVARHFAAKNQAEPGTAAAAKLAVVTSATGAKVQPPVASGLVWADHASRIL